jgi:hypothetical protein
MFLKWTRERPEMKKQKDQYQAIVDGMRLIEDLLIPQVTPRVPSHIRDRARSVMKNFPSEAELKTILDQAQKVKETQ